MNVEKTPRALMDLPVTATCLDEGAYGRALSAFLTRTPLTDLATASRPSPAFYWTAETLGLIASRTGRTLALGRFPSRRPGRSTRARSCDAPSVQVQAWQAAMVALDLLGERALAEAESVASSSDKPLPRADSEGDASFARGAGALVARQMIATRGEAFSETERHRLLGLLELRASSPAAKETERLLAHGA